MIAIYRFLATYEGLIYLVLVIGGIFLLRWLWRTWSIWRGAVFGLEREISRRRFARAIGANVLWLVLFLGAVAITSFIIPSMRPSALIATPTVDLLVTPTGTISAEMAATIAARPAPQAEDYSDGCVPGQIIIDSPVPGQALSGIVELQGTVNTEKFGFYKLEVSPVNAEKWATVYAGRDTVRDDVLGRVDTNELIPGDYSLRLVVVDNVGESMPPCVIQIHVVAQQE
jgi:hypothetical protein